MAEKKKSTAPAEKIALYEKLVASIPGIELKGATMLYTSINGHMFSFLDKDGNLGLRLPAPERDAFLKQYKSTLFHTHGTILKEYVFVPENLLKKTELLHKYLSISFKYVNQLKPKPTTRKKKE